MEKIIEQADALMEHRISLLGTNKVNIDREDNLSKTDGNKINSIYNKIIKQSNKEYNPINWNRDYISGYKFPKHTESKKIVYGEMLSKDFPGADIKTVWELGRLQHLMYLVEAYHETKGGKYAEEVLYQLIDFRENNIVGYGPNWRCTMDVGIRLANIVIVITKLWRYFYYEKDENGRTQYFIEMVYEHCDFIMNNLEVFGTKDKRLTSNHYLADIAGLAIGAFYLDETEPKAKGWLEFALGELRHEIDIQVYDDETDFEASTYYHRLVTELLFYPMLIISGGDKDEAIHIFGKHYVTKVEGMLDTTMLLLKPNGEMPVIGDNDNGRLFTLYPRSINDMRYLLFVGAEFYKNDGLIIKEFYSKSYEVMAEVYSFWNYPVDREKRYVENAVGFDLKDISGVYDFKNSGWFVVRGNKDYLLICYGPNGQGGRGGHGHNDKLSYVWMVDGKDIVIDRGNYNYTGWPEKRDEYRKTESHNTVYIEGLEQNELNGIWKRRDQTKVTLDYEIDEDGKVNIVCTLRNYNGKLINLVRYIYYDIKGRELEVEDFILTGKKEYTDIPRINNIYMTIEGYNDCEVMLGLEKCNHTIVSERAKSYNKIERIIRIKTESMNYTLKYEKGAKGI